MADATPTARRVLLKRAIGASALVAGAGSIGMAHAQAQPDVAGMTLAFASRADLAAWLGSQNSEPIDGVRLSVGPLDFVTQAGATAIADLPGLIPGSEITPAHFGFDLGGAADANALAVTAALLYADGRPVWVRAPKDFTCDAVEVRDVPVDLHFEGTGRWDLSAGGRALLIRNAHEPTQDVRDLAKVNYELEGATSPAQRITVSAPGKFVRGDVVKVFSDEIEEAASESRPRRKGEFAVVVEVSETDVWTTLLQDKYDLDRNVRIAKLRPTSLSVSGLKVRSATTNRSPVLMLTASFRPRIEMDVLNHGAIVANIHGAYEGEFRLTGSGFTDQPGDTLGYLANDSNGWHNRFWLRGKFFRHTYTSNHETTKEGEDAPERYGRTRRPWVTGISESTWGAAWDTHDGCDEAVFENCVALGAMSGFDNAAAFQLRGIGGTIINGYADDSFDQFLRLNVTARGVIRVINPTSTSDRALTGPNETGTLNPTVLWVGGSMEARDTPALFEVGASRLRVSGGARLAVTHAWRDDGSIFRLRGSTLHTSPDTLVEVGGKGAGFRVVTLEASGSAWTGGLRLSHRGVDWRAIAVGDDAASTAVFKATIEDGAMVQPVAGDLSYDRHVVQCLSDPEASTTNLRTLDEFIRTVGAL